MLTYNFENRNGLPLYDFLYRSLRDDILSGALAPGERLPSKRALAQHLHLSVITVENAYQQLVAEGYVDTVPRKGFFVANVDRPPPAPAYTPALSTTRAEPALALDLNSPRIDPAFFPSALWAKLTRQVLAEDRHLIPSPHQGLPELRLAIANYLHDFKGMRVSPGQIVVGAGAEYLYLLLAQLLGRNARFALEDPGYPKIHLVYTKWGAACSPIPLDQHGLSLQHLYNSHANVVHLSPAHHFPTGIVTSISRRHALLRWAEEAGGILIEDDYDSEFRFSGRPLPTLQSIDAHGRVIYLNTFSQTISPSIRIGFMVLPPRLLLQYQDNLSFYASTVPSLDQLVLAKFLANGFYEQHLSRVRKRYRTLRSDVLHAFSHFGSITDFGAGLHFLLKLHPQRKEEALRRKAEGLGIRLAFLSDFASIRNPDFQHTLVVSYASLNQDKLQQAVELLNRLLLTP